MDVAENYLRVVEEIEKVAKKCGRKGEEITLLPVSKRHPLEHIIPAYRAGCRVFGENRIQEALEKMEFAPQDIKWHMIGTLQKNKVRKAIGKFALIHSVHSKELAEKISDCSEEAGVVTSILLEVNTSEEETKHGFSPDELRGLFPEILNLKGVQIEGLMTMAPFVQDEEIIRTCFANLRKLKEELGLKHLSMGMTHDYPLAIAEGATILRIGTAIFGNRK